MREGEGMSQKTPKKQGHALDMMCGFSQTKERRDSKPALEYENCYKLGSLVPQIILVGIILYIYYSMMIYYVMPLALGRYDLESFNVNSFNKLLIQISSSKEAPKSSFFLSMVTMQESFFSLCAMLGKFNLDQTKGWVIFSILHILLVLLIWAIIKTSKTPPGKITESKRWKEEIDGFEQQLEDQEMGFLQAFEQKYSMVYLRNQRQSKNIPVDERAIETLSGADNPIQSQNVFSDKNDSEDENHSAFYLPETGKNMPLHPIKEIPRESLEESVRGVEDKQPAIDLSFHHGEEHSFRSESEVVFEDRQGETAMTAQVAQFFSEKNSRENLDKNPDVYDQEEYDRLLQQLYRMHVEQEIEKRNYRPCKKCDNVIKPPRTHHCSQCKDCVLKMDHHCQWVDNCIGFRNYKYFLNMLFYASIALSFCSVTFAKCYLDACVSNKLSEGRMFRIALSFFFIITMNFFVLSFTIFHFWLVMQNKTTIEFCEKKTDSQKYNLGCWYNLKQVFGSNIFTWFIPTEPDIEGDGTLFLLSMAKEI